MKIVKKIKISLLMTFFIIILFNIKCFAVTGVITEITINLREKPSTDSKKIRYVTQDDVVEVLEKDGEWYKIKFEGTTGYVFGKYLKVDDSKLEKKEENTKNEEVTTSKDETKKEEQDITKDISLKLQIKEKTDLRVIPNIISNVIYTSKKAMSIEVIEQIGVWSYITVDKITGWVRTDCIIEESAEKENDSNSNENTKTEIAYIKYDTVNLRAKKSTSAKVLAKLKLNDKVTVLEKVDSKWSKVKVDGITGYISTELLSDKKQEEKEEPETTSRDTESASREEKNETSKKEETVTKVEEQKEELEEKDDTTTQKEDTSKVTGEKIVEYAKKYLGYKYVSGGASPSKGFDCSGFTYYVYKNFGYTLSRTSKAQAENGTAVAKEDLQPGDLIIYKNTSLTAIGHVGIYIGDNKMIHASEPGVGVTITDIDSKAYKYPERYVTARRIIK